MKYLQLIIFLCILSFTVSCGQQKKYIQYKVKEGETMRTIARDLDMTTKDLLRLNPDIGRRPEPNTLIIIPNKTNTNTSGDTTDSVITDETTIEIKTDSIKGISEIDLEDLRKQFVIHEVKKGDTFYSLTRFFNVTQEELVALNPLLSEGLKEGTFIKIKPIGDEDENLLYEDFIEEDVLLNVAMMLPFRATEYDTIPAKDIFRNNMLADIVTDFYLGAEIAIDSLEQRGISIELNVFDTGRKGTRIREIIANNDLDEHDVIIGPFYSDEARIVANNVSIPVVFPVYSKRQPEFSSSRLVKTSPDKKKYKKLMLDYLRENYSNQNVIVVSDTIQRNLGNLYETVSTLRQYDSITPITVLEPEEGYIKKELFVNALKPNVDNWVLIDTQDNVIAADAINSLISLPTEEDIERETKKGKKIKMQALPEDTVVKVFAFEKGKMFDKIANSKLSKLSFTYAAAMFEDGESYGIKLFNKKYEERNNALPSHYATKGFDITYDILMRLASGEYLKSTFKRGVSYRLESKFDFSRKLFSTSENNGLFIVQYNPDLSLTRLK